MNKLVRAGLGVTVSLGLEGQGDGVDSIHVESLDVDTEVQWDSTIRCTSCLGSRSVETRLPGLRLCGSCGSFFGAMEAVPDGVYREVVTVTDSVGRVAHRSVALVVHGDTGTFVDCGGVDGAGKWTDHGLTGDECCLYHRDLRNGGQHV